MNREIKTRDLIAAGWHDGRRLGDALRASIFALISGCFPIHASISSLQQAWIQNSPGFPDRRLGNLVHARTRYPQLLSDFLGFYR